MCFQTFLLNPGSMKKTNVMRILDQQKIDYIVIEYEYDPDQLSVEKIATNNAIPLELVYKTLVAIGDKTGPVVAVVPGGKTLDFKAFAALSGNKKVGLAPVKDIQQLTGYIRGGCSPIGMKKHYPVWLDQSADTHEKIFVNAGSRGLLVQLNPTDLLNACNGQLGQLS